MDVLVNGIGTIGTTLLNLLVDFQNELGIQTIYAKKRTLAPWNLADLKYLEQRGVVICAHEAQASDFQKHFSRFVAYEDIKEEIDYIFETSANKVGNANKNEFAQLKRLKGVCAQGSEKGFGIPFMSGINEEKIHAQRFVQVVSCNTHASLAVLNCFGGTSLENLDEADFVVVRRSEDLGNHERLVSANVLARHLDSDIGTHHALDALDVLKTIGLHPRITSSDVTTPSQLLHTFRFNLKLKRMMTLQDIRHRVGQLPLVACTSKFDSNKVFEFGRKYSRYGRLYAQMILVDSNMILQQNRVVGWAFIPQEGNTILSTLHAYLLQIQHQHARPLFEKICNQLVIKEL